MDRCLKLTSCLASTVAPLTGTSSTTSELFFHPLDEDLELTRRSLLSQRHLLARPAHRSSHAGQVRHYAKVVRCAPSSFLPSKRLLTLPLSTVGATTEAKNQLDQFGRMAFGGAGMLVSDPLMTEMYNVWDSCHEQFKHIFGGGLQARRYE